MSEATAAKTLEDETSAEAPAVEQPAEQIEPMQPITAGRMNLRVETRNSWLVNVPHGTLPEQLFEESVWAHLAIRVRVGDELIVMPDDMSWEMVLHVKGKGKTYVHVVMKVFYELAATERGEHLPSIYKIDFAGSHYKWRVIRGDKLVRDGFESESLARRYAANHEAAIDR